MLPLFKIILIKRIIILVLPSLFAEGFNQLIFQVHTLLLEEKLDKPRSSVPERTGDAHDLPFSLVRCSFLRPLTHSQPCLEQSLTLKDLTVKSCFSLVIYQCPNTRCCLSFYNYDNGTCPPTMRINPRLRPYQNTDIAKKKRKKFTHNVKIVNLLL